jgi:type IV pilus assembly protein PilQ
LGTVAQAQPSFPVATTGSADRFGKLRRDLQVLADSVTPGLNQQANLSVTGVSLQEFVRGLADTHGLNVSVDPTLSVRVSSNFTGVKVLDLLVFLAREYDLDVRTMGNILSFYKYTAPPPVKVASPAKKLRLAYNETQDRLTADLAGDSLSSFVKQATQLTKHNISLAPGLGGRVITGYVEGLPLTQALDRLAYANALRLSQPDGQSYVLLPAEEVAVAGAKATASRRPHAAGGNGSISIQGRPVAVAPTSP